MYLDKFAVGAKGVELHSVMSLIQLMLGLPTCVVRDVSKVTDKRDKTCKLSQPSFWGGQYCGIF